MGNWCGCCSQGSKKWELEGSGGRGGNNPNQVVESLPSPAPEGEAEDDQDRSRASNASTEDDQDQDRSRASTASTAATKTPFLETPDAIDLLEPQLGQIFLDQINNSLELEETSEDATRSTNIQPFDPRLIHLLEFFRKLSLRKMDLFRRVIPFRREEISKVLKKMAQHIESRQEHDDINNYFLQRSRSYSFESEVDHLDSGKVKLKRFKVDSGKVQQGTAGGGGATSNLK